jgi:hypothetical protein
MQKCICRLRGQWIFKAPDGYFEENPPKDGMFSYAATANYICVSAFCRGKESAHESQLYQGF